MQKNFFFSKSACYSAVEVLDFLGTDSSDSGSSGEDGDDI